MSTAIIKYCSNPTIIKHGLIPFGIYMSGYWITGLIYFLRDYLKCRREGIPMRIKEYKRGFWNSLFNQIATSPLLIYLTFRMTRRLSYETKTFKFKTLLFDLLSMIIFGDFAFYYMHRLMHVKYLFTKIHQVHHQLNPPIGISANDTHVVEHVLVNTGPMIVAFAAAKHMYSVYLVILLGTINSIKAHHSPDTNFILGSKRHVLHHEKLKVNFGFTGLADRLHGTEFIE